MDRSDKFTNGRFIRQLDSYGILSIYKDGVYYFTNRDNTNALPLNDEGVLLLARELIDMVVRKGDSMKFLDDSEKAKLREQ